MTAAALRTPTLRGVSSASSERRTVLHLINTGGPGGAETVCLNIARGLDRKRWRSIAVVPDRGWIFQELTAAGVETLVIGHGSRASVVGYLFELARLIRLRDVELVHSHLFGPTVVASLLGTIMRVPVLGTLHGVGDLDARESFQRAKFALLGRGVTRLVFVSEALREYFLETGVIPRERTAVIQNGVQLQDYDGPRDRSLRQELGAEDATFLVGALGNLRRAKGYDVFLRAAALLLERSQDYRFVIVGREDDPELRAELGALAEELGVADTVKFAGFRPDVPRVMGALDLFAMTSRSEGFSIATVEAMAAGLPVVATRCGGPEGIVDDGVSGLLVPNESPAAVADAIHALRSDDMTRERLGAAARLAVAERFEVGAQVRAYERLYDDCLSTRASAHLGVAQS